MSSYEHSPVCDIFERQIPAWSRACCANRNEISAKNERETPTNVPALIINCGSSDWRTVNRHLFRASESSMFLALEAVCVSNRMLQRSWTMHWPVLAESHQGILLPAERQGCYQRSSCNVETLTMERFSDAFTSLPSKRIEISLLDTNRLSPLPRTLKRTSIFEAFFRRSWKQSTQAVNLPSELERASRQTDGD